MVTCLGLPDSAIGDHRDALQQGLRQVLRPSDWVVSPWRFDGHPDHDATGTETARVCADLGCRLIEAPVWMWHWSAPDDAPVLGPAIRARAAWGAEYLFV